ncbi:MAG: family 16 glycoside hydrolase [Cytophagales bacterium]|nr:family 16 glycoside hydrolase [Cytophagales bacterium]
MRSLVFSLTIAVISMAQAQQLIPIDDPRFEYFEREPRRVETFKGRKAIYLNGRASLKDIPFQDGILQVDFTAAKPRAFAGFVFRAQDEENYEAVYVRLHKSRMPDAIQYNPEYNGESNWQLYGEHQSFATFDQNDWNTLRIEIRGSELKVYLNDFSKPLLTVENLRHKVGQGFIGFYSFLGAYFSNFRYEAFTDLTTAKPLSAYEKGVIQNWQLSESELLAEVDTEAYPNVEEIKWKSATSEPSGLLPINKYVRKIKAGNFEQNEHEVVWARYTFNAEQPETRKFYFDYSDNIELFFNGHLIFSGKNAFRYKGLTFRGDIKLEGNMLYLNTREGENEILCAVSDKANGWAILGKIQ